MDNRGQMGMLGGIIMLAMTLIVGAILLQGSAQNIDNVINTDSVTGQLTFPGLNGVYNFTGYKDVSSFVAVNASGGAAITAANYSIASNVLVNGVPTAQLTALSTANITGYLLNVTYTGQPTEYESSSGGRAIASLIILLMALAMVAVAVAFAVKTYQQ